jgi:putative MATE family efflux protein
MSDPEPLIAAPAIAPPEVSIWETFREAIRGSERDFTETPVGRAVVLLAVPMVLEMVMESVFAVADVFFVGRLGADAVATVGLTESLMTILYAAAAGLAIGATAIVARRVGERDRERAARAAAQSLILAVGFGAIVGGIGIAAAPWLLRTMGATADVVRSGAAFTRVMLGSSGAVVLLFLINAIFRGAGDAAVAMRVLWFANAINIVLGPCLIFGVGPFPELGVTGAAVGTSIGRSAGVVLQIVLLTRRSGRLVLQPRHFRPRPAVLASIVRLSGAAVLQNMISTASWIGLVRILAGFGSAALAGNTIGIRIVLFALLPSLGIGNAAAALVGQNLGARRPDRAEAAVWTASRYSTIYLAAVGFVFLVLSPTLVSFFTRDAEVAAYGARCLRIIAGGFLFYGSGMVVTAAFNGAGDTRTPTLINVLCLWLWEIPLAWTLAYPAGLGPTGVFIAVAAAFATLAAVSAWLFRLGHWKSRHI